MCCLNKDLGVEWKDKIINDEVLKRVKMQTLFTIIDKRQLQWLGQGSRMDDGRIPRDVLCGELGDAPQ